MTNPLAMGQPQAVLQALDASWPSLPAGSRPSPGTPASRWKIIHLEGTGNFGYRPCRGPSCCNAFWGPWRRARRFSSDRPCRSCGPTDVATIHCRTRVLCAPAAASLRLAVGRSAPKPRRRRDSSTDGSAPNPSSAPRRSAPLAFVAHASRGARVLARDAPVPAGGAHPRNIHAAPPRRRRDVSPRNIHVPGRGVAATRPLEGFKMPLEGFRSASSTRPTSSCTART